MHLALVPEEYISKKFMRSIVLGAEYFGRLQGAVIWRNVRLFDEFPQHEGRMISQARRLFVREWMRRYQIRPIDPKERIACHKILTGAAQGNRVGGQRGHGKRSDEGNLEARQAKKVKVKVLKS